MKTKVCTVCGEEYPATTDYFYAHHNKRDGLETRCIFCRRKYQKKYREENKDVCTARTVKWQRDNPDKRKVTLRKHNYGITEEEFIHMYNKQKEVCAICGKPETRILKGKTTILCVDHNHNTGKVRGLLCHRCNVALGVFDSVSLLDNAKGYLINNDDKEKENES
jgi:hypothetical protein